MKIYPILVDKGENTTNVRDLLEKLDSGKFRLVHIAGDWKAKEDGREILAVSIEEKL